MTKFEYINQYINPIKKDVKLGFMPCSILRHFAIYSRFEYYKRIGNKRSDAIICTQNDFQISERQICRIIKNMETTI